MVEISRPKGPEFVYKQSLTRLDKILKRLDNITSEKRSEYEKDGEEITVYSNEKKSRYILRNIQILNNIASILESLSFHYPKSKWSDDANFILAIEYIIITQFAGKDFKNAIEIYNHLINILPKLITSYLIIIGPKKPL